MEEYRPTDAEEFETSRLPSEDQKEDVVGEKEVSLKAENEPTDDYSPDIDFDDIGDKQFDEVLIDEPVSEALVEQEKQDVIEHTEEVSIFQEEVIVQTVEIHVKQTDAHRKYTSRTPMKKIENNKKKETNSASNHKREKSIKRKKINESKKKNKENLKKEASPPKQKTNEEILLINIECCQNCKAHQYCTHHKEEKYQNFFNNFKEQLLMRMPEATVKKNFGIPCPRLGAFTIHVGEKVVFCKLKAKAWPNISEVVERTIKILQNNDELVYNIEKEFLVDAKEELKDDGVDIIDTLPKYSDDAPSTPEKDYSDPPPAYMDADNIDNGEPSLES